MAHPANERFSGRSTSTRRNFFTHISDGVYGIALTHLLCRDLYATSNLITAAQPAVSPTRRASYEVTPRRPHLEPRAKSVILLFMSGGPSPMDLLDPKPLLNEYNGQPYFDRVAADVQSAEQAGGLLRSPFQFAQHGESGIWVSEIMPHLAKQVDEITVIRSMHTTTPAHPAALYKFQGGRSLPSLPTIGAWIVYGLGTENQNLPAFVVLDDPLGLPINGIANWQSGFLPPVYQGTRLRSSGDAILNLRAERKEPPALIRLGTELRQRLDRIHRQERPRLPQLDARIASYELAARLQLEATDALDLSQESPRTLEMYGVGNRPQIVGKVYTNPGPDNYARRCIMARRLVERGVRFVQVCVNDQIWDTHAHLENDLAAACERTDQPVAALLRDLKERGLLDTTLVVWAGEFGRHPIAQVMPTQGVAGRDHNPRGFSIWMAGGGVKAGTIYGSTDEFGYRAVENPVSISDFHATILHLLGLHHEELFFERNGLQEKITFTFEASIVEDILA